MHECPLSRDESEKRTPRIPLTLLQRQAWATASANTDAIFALDDIPSTWQDRAITDAIVAGRVHPEQVREEMLAYVREQKSLHGFVESRGWAIEACPEDG